MHPENVSSVTPASQRRLLGESPLEIDGIRDLRGEPPDMKQSPASGRDMGDDECRR